MKFKKPKRKYTTEIVDTTDYSDKKCVICGHTFNPEIITVVVKRITGDFKGFICPECVKIAHLDGYGGDFPLWHTFYMNDTCRIIGALKKAYSRHTLQKIMNLIGKDIGAAIDNYRINRELIEPSRQVSKILQGIEYLDEKDELREELLNGRVRIPVWIAYQKIKSAKEQKATNSRVEKINGKETMYI